VFARYEFKDKWVLRQVSLEPRAMHTPLVTKLARAPPITQYVSVLMKYSRMVVSTKSEESCFAHLDLIVLITYCHRPLSILQLESSTTALWLGWVR